MGGEFIVTGAMEDGSRFGFNSVLYVWGFLVLALVFCLNFEMLPNAERILCADQWVVDHGDQEFVKGCAKFGSEELPTGPGLFATVVETITGFYAYIQIAGQASHLDPMLFLFDEEIYVHKEIKAESDLIGGGIFVGLMILLDKLILLAIVFIAVIVPASYCIRYTLYVLVRRLAREEILNRFFAAGYTTRLIFEFPLFVVLVSIVVLAAGEHVSSFASGLEYFFANDGENFGFFTSHFGDFLLIAFSSGVLGILISHTVDGLFLAIGRDPYASYLDDLIAAIVVAGFLIGFTNAGVTTIASAIIVGVLHSLLQKTFGKGAVREV